MTETTARYRNAFSRDSFLAKVRRVALTAGREAIETALILFFTLREPGVPAWARAAITAALGYFIVPTDALIDLAPAIGYADDASVLVAALIAVAMHVTPRAKHRAAETMEALFGKGTSTSGEPASATIDT